MSGNKRGRPPKRGRPRSQHNKERKKIQDARFLFTKKAPSEKEADCLNSMLAEHSALNIPRDFAVQVYGVFDAKDRNSADSVRQAILTDKRFRADPNLAKSVARLEDNDRFDKLVLHLEYKNLERTSNHVERDNRRFRKRQKAHYRLRLETTIRNALNLKMEAERRMKAGHQAPKLQPRTAT